MERRQRADRRGRRLHLRPGQADRPAVLDHLGLRGQHRGHRPPDRHHQDQGQAVQPELRQERADHHLHRAQGDLEQVQPRQDHRRAEHGAGRLRPVQARQGRPDPGQPDSRRRLLGQGRLRHSADEDDQPPHLQGQRRRRPQAGERRDRRRSAVHPPDLEDVGGQGQAGRHLAEGEAVLPARSDPFDHLQPVQEGPGQPEGSAGDRVLRSTTRTSPAPPCRTTPTQPTPR